MHAIDGYVISQYQAACARELQLTILNVDIHVDFSGKIASLMT